MFVSDLTIAAHKELLQERKDKAGNTFLAQYTTYDESNPFSKILRGEIETKLVDETPYAITIENAVQRTDTYNLVLPVYPAIDVLDFLQNAPDEHKIGYHEAIAKAVREICPKYQTKTNDLNNSCARVLFNVGPYSQNTVNHCHAHVTGDKEHLNAQYLLMPEKSYESVPHVHLSVSEHIDGDYETGRICRYESNYKVGEKETKLYLSDFTPEQTLNELKKLVCFLTAFNKMSMCMQNGEGNWGGRVVIDTDDRGFSIVTASSGVRLNKLPKTPLTVSQQKACYDDLGGRSKGNER